MPEPERREPDEQERWDKLDPREPAPWEPDHWEPEPEEPEPEEPEPEEPEPRRRPGLANWILAGLIAGFGIVAFVVAVNTGRTDSALLFVALPVVLAMAMAVTPTRDLHARVFVCVTIALLLTAVALHEGAICVILAAPLVYLVAHGVTWIATGLRRRYALVVVPLLLATGLEGTDESLRFQPVQSVEVVRVVALPADEVRARIEAGPRPAPVGPVSLRLLGVPVPEHVSALQPGGGLAPGDRWSFGYHGSSHGPGGHIVTEVTTSEAGAHTGRVGFDVVSDTAITARWFAWEHAEITWRAVDGGRTEVRVTATFTRGLDPAWYFGPLQEALMGQGMAHLLDMLRLPDPATA